MKQKKLPIGVSDFKNLIDGNYEFIDKSLFIEEIVQSPLVTLIPRPRRFGKTLNLSMLRYYFEKKSDGTDERSLFKDLKITQSQGEHTNWLGKYPIVFLTFKDVKEDTFERSFDKIRKILADCYNEKNYLLNSDVLSESEKITFQKILDRSANDSDLHYSLLNLTRYLEKFHNEKIIVLIDEYDTPIHAGFLIGYYDQIILFFRGFLGSLLKDNSSLQKSVLTGILRVAKESIFSGLNNIGVYSLLQEKFSKYFGLTQKEVESLLQKYDLLEKTEDVKKWYNGYLFGEVTVYNPWSILCYLDDKFKVFQPHWINTANNALIEKILTQNGNGFRDELLALLRGEIVEKEIVENIILADVMNNEDCLWSFLLFCGYLKTNETLVQKPNFKFTLSIPNAEVKIAFESFVKRWMQQRIQNPKLETMLKALTNGNIEIFEIIFSEFVLQSLSYHDVSRNHAEAVYHSFALGLFVMLKETHDVKSNGEAGTGRYDVLLIPHDKTKLGVIVEFKIVHKLSVKKTLQEAMKQIDREKYAQALKSSGVRKILKLAIAFQGKNIFCESV